MVPRYSSALIQTIRAHLDRGGVIAYATESCYGLGCDPRNAAAVRRLLRLKGRPQEKGLILVAGQRSQIEPFIAPLSEKEQRALSAAWPGPVTFLLRPSPRTPRWLRGGHDKFAVRITAHPDAAGLCNALDMALVSTSANRSGLKPFRTYRECAAGFGVDVMVIPGRIGKRRRPSTIRDLESGKIIRT